VQSFAEVLASELARLDLTEIPPAAAFAPPARTFENGLMAAMGAAFFIPEIGVAPVIVPPAPEPAVERLLRRFRAEHLEPTILTMALRLFDDT